MKAIKFAEPWKVACVDQEMPTPKEGEALIKIHCAAVCGSDIGAFPRHQRPGQLSPGHRPRAQR